MAIKTILIKGQPGDCRTKMKYNSQSITAIIDDEQSL